MKFLVELIGSAMIGALAAVLIVLLGIEITVTQSAILIAGILVIASIVHGITAAINNKSDAKKQN